MISGHGSAVDHSLKSCDCFYKVFTSHHCFYDSKGQGVSDHKTVSLCFVCMRTAFVVYSSISIWAQYSIFSLDLQRKCSTLH